MFSEPYMQRALLAALVLGPLCALLGVFVTARRMAFFSDTVAHSSLAGVALGLALGFRDPSAIMVLVSLAVALLILWLHERTELLTDTIMALLMSTFMAAGLIGYSLLRGFRGELDRYLFGDIFSVGPGEVAFAWLLGIVVFAVLFAYLSPLTLVTVHPDLAHVAGLPVRKLNLVFVVLLTLVVAISIRLLGIILVTSLVVIPPATARNLARNLRQEILLSLLAGLAGGMGGLILSFQFNLPGGPSIVVTASALFVAALIAGLWRQRSKRPSPSVS